VRTGRAGLTAWPSAGDVAFLGDTPVVGVTGRNASEGLPVMSPEGERGGGSHYSEQATTAERVFLD
jgi:hypothetical protein